MFSLESPRCEPSSKPTEEVANSQWYGNNKAKEPHDAEKGCRLDPKIEQKGREKCRRRRGQVLSLVLLRYFIDGGRK